MIRTGAQRKNFLKVAQSENVKIKAPFSLKKNKGKQLLLNVGTPCWPLLMKLMINLEFCAFGLEIWKHSILFFQSHLRFNVLIFFLLVSSAAA